MAGREGPRPKKAKKGGGTLWSSSKGWKSLSVADELLLGAEEAGFAGLEVLEDVTLLDAACLQSLDEAARQQRAAADDAAAGEAGGKKQKAGKQKQQKEQKEQKAAGGKRGRGGAADAAGGGEGSGGGEGGSEGGGGGDDVASLKAKLQQLEAENRALKRQKKQKGGGGTDEAAAAAAAGGEAASADAKPLSARKQRRLEQLRQKNKERKQRLKEQRQQKRGLGSEQQQDKQQKKEWQTKKQEQRQQAKPQAERQPEAAAATDSPAPQADMSAWARFSLHPRLVAALAAQGFTSPTPIQDAVLLPAIRDRRDVVGAAQTGSGKTLAFGLPILHVLLQERDLQQGGDGQGPATEPGEAEGGGDDDGDSGEDENGAAATAGSGGAPGAKQKKGGPLRALILAPTRELALQVCEHLQALGRPAGVHVVPLVGGIAPVKQERLLRARPPVVVATPGRLWDLMRNGNSHLCGLDSLSFFVLDEADRMVQQGHYQELTNILELLPTPERAAAVAAAAEAEAAEQAELARQAAKHRRKLQRQQQKQQQRRQKQQGANGGGSGDGSDDPGARSEEEGEEGESEEQEGEDEAEDGEEEEEEGSEEEEDEEEHRQEGEEGSEEQEAVQPGGRQAPQGRARRHLLQTFVFSATLTLPAQLHKRLRKGGGGSSGAASLESLMDRLSFRSRPAVVDLSPSTRLAERVSEGLLQTLDEERDASLYYLLARHPGRALVFVNAVSAVRRVAALLQLLGLPASALHAQQQQRQRLKALDRFKAHPHGVLVATDVAARGLDIPDVQIVVHYQLPASADTYIHRSGRTARTGGSDGVVLAMVTPGDAARWAALRHALEGQEAPPSFPVDDKVLLAAKQRVSLASRIDAIQRQERKQHAAATWARSNADALGIDLDADEDERQAEQLAHAAVSQAARAARGKKARRPAAAGGGDADDARAQDRARAAGQLSGELAALQRQLAAALAAPLQPTLSHKYFTGGVSRAASAAAAAAAAGAGAQPGGEEAAKPLSVLPADAIAQTVQLAARLRQSRAGEVAAAGGTGGLAAAGAGMGAGKKALAGSAGGAKARRAAAAAALAAAAAPGAAALKAVGGVAAKGRRAKGGPQAKAGGGAAAAALARMLMSNNERKRQRRAGGGMVVVRPGAGGAFGRDALGVSALDVLASSAR